MGVLYYLPRDNVSKTKWRKIALSNNAHKDAFINSLRAYIFAYAWDENKIITEEKQVSVPKGNIIYLEKGD